MRTSSCNLFSRIAALLAVPALLLVAGCDSDDNGGDNEAPSASFTVSPESPAAGTEVTFDASASSDSDGEIDAYEWDFGNGSSGTGETVTHTYDTEGDYDVELTVIDDEGASGSTTESVSVGTGGGNAVTTPSVNYDTTGTTIAIEETDGGQEGIVLIDEDGNVIDEGDGDESSVTWTSGYEYVLRGRVFVNDGQTLNIEPGTVIRGSTEFDDPENASALIVAQGGTINADGTAEEPIIFTAEGQPTDAYDFDLRNQWGGVIILGRASNNLSPSGDGAGVINVEGIPTEVTRGRYGCGEDGITCDDDESSGTFRYVSIRHGGTSIGAGNEINGLTMGSVGSGTTIEYVEVVSNQDDGFEWFGGTVDATHLVSTFVGDDSFDIDQGYTGRLQYLLAVQGNGGGDHGGEHDGGDSDLGGEDSTPLTDPQICNATYLGASDGTTALLLRDNFAGDYYNSIFVDFPNGFIEIEDLGGNAEDSRARFEAGELNLAGNIVFGFGAGSFADVIQLTRDGDTDEIIDASFREPLAEYLAQNNRLGVDAGVSAYDGSSADVVPEAGGPAFSDVADTDGACLEDAGYVGAFDSDDNWAAGWTTLSRAGVIGN